MKVKMLTRHGVLEKGEETDVTEARAEYWKRMGIAEEVKPKKKAVKKKEEKQEVTTKELKTGTKTKSKK